jgi:hypothetical protein
MVRRRHDASYDIAARAQALAEPGSVVEKPKTPAAEVSDPGFQDQLASKVAELTGVSLF